MLETAISIFLFVISFVIGASFLAASFIVACLVYIAYQGGK